MSTLLFRPFIFYLFCLLVALLMTRVETTWRPVFVGRRALVVLLLPLCVLAGLVLWHEVEGRQISRERNATLRLLRAGQCEHAGMHIRRLIHLLPDHPVAHLHHAHLLAGCLGPDTMTWSSVLHCPGDIDGAVAALMRATQAEPRDETLEFAIGWMYACQSRWPEAQRHLQRAYRVDSTLSIYPLAIGIVAEKSGDISQSLSYYAQALSLDPALHLSRFFSELTSRYPERYSKLLAEAADQIDKTDPILLARLGALRYFQEDYQSARTHLMRALAELPGMNRPYFYLGQIALSSGDTLQALGLWDKASFLDPQDQYVNWHYGKLLAGMGSPLAKTKLEQATKARNYEPVFPKRRNLYNRLTPYPNATLPESFIEYISPDVDQVQVDHLLRTLQNGPE